MTTCGLRARSCAILGQAPTLEIPHPRVERVEHGGDSSGGGGYRSRGCTMPFFLQLFVDYSYVHLVPEEP
ncbi:mannose receptor, C type [Sarotherodon galilaeus]